MAAVAKCSTSGGRPGSPEESGKGNGRVCEGWTEAKNLRYNFRGAEGDSGSPDVLIHMICTNAARTN